MGCDTSQCGACVVHVNGKAIKSCTMLVLQAEGADVLTIEGLAPNATDLHPMQEAFRENHGLQCGYCTPGMIMTAVDMVNRKGHDLDERRSAKSWKAISVAAPAIATSSSRLPPAQGPWAKAVVHKGRRVEPSILDAGIRRLSAGRNRHERATGIGAAVRRRRFRFITGRGQYTADISRAGQAHISFVRSRTPTPKSNDRYESGRVFAWRARGADRRRSRA